MSDDNNKQIPKSMSTSSDTIFKRKKLTVDDYVSGILQRNRTILAQTITLVESHLPIHMDMAQEVLQKLLPYTGNSIRIGITGVPGAGKSTFIEELGLLVCEKDHRIAVLAIDPSSTLNRGSILGDKTRMELLSRNKQAFIRPSASRGELGGVARNTRESILVCEAFGFDVVVVETVGVGQSEVTVRSMVDFFLLLQLTGAGDELQGVKKGVIELVDAILINKADGQNFEKAIIEKEVFNQLLHYLQAATPSWSTKAFTCSALKNEGIEEIWSVIEQFRTQTSGSGEFQKRRQNQKIEWLNRTIQEQIQASFFQHNKVTEFMPKIKEAVVDGEMSVTAAAHFLLQIFKETQK